MNTLPNAEQDCPNAEVTFNGDAEREYEVEVLSGPDGEPEFAWTEEAWERESQHRG